MEHPILLVMEQQYPEPNPANKFRIAEMYLTHDKQMRTRMTEHSFSSIEEARFYVSTHGG